MVRVQLIDGETVEMPEAHYELVQKLKDGQPITLKGKTFTKADILGHEVDKIPQGTKLIDPRPQFGTKLKTEVKPRQVPGADTTTKPLIEIMEERGLDTNWYYKSKRSQRRGM